MVAAMLVLYGAVLFVNAFFLLGKVDPKSAGPLNAVIGTIGVIIGFYTGFANALGTYSAFVAALVIIFAITFLIVAAMVFGALDGKAVGYYCLFGAIACFMWAYGFYAIVGSASNGTFSIVWGLLFSLFAANLAFGRPWAKPTAYATLFTAFATLLIPGFLLLLGVKLP
jgi:putative amide transporter protein